MHRLKKDLLDGYDRSIRPSRNPNTPTTVQLQLSLARLAELVSLSYNYISIIISYFVYICKNKHTCDNFTFLQNERREELTTFLWLIAVRIIISLVHPIETGGR